MVVKRVRDRKEYEKEYYLKNKAMISLRNKKRRNTEEGRQWAREYVRLNRGKINKRICEHRQEVKREVLTHYGGGRCACVVCGEARPACLGIDHVYGKGRRHRYSINPKLGGGAFYKWLKRNNYPQGYQALCMNCQWVKRFTLNEN